MANFMEAMKAIDSGKRARLPEGNWLRRGVNNDCVFDDYTGHPAFIYIWMLHRSDWEIEQPKPKEYTLAEALEMMKAGKAMKSVVGSVYCITGGCLIYGVSLRLATLNLKEIEGPWTEAT